MLMKAHYRQPLDWSEAALEQAQRTLDGLYGTLRDLADVDAGERTLPAEFLAALADDLNTPEALAMIARLAEDARKAPIRRRRKRRKPHCSAPALFSACCSRIRKHGSSATAARRGRGLVQRLLAERAERARRQEFAESDRMRDGSPQAASSSRTARKARAGKSPQRETR